MKSCWMCLWHNSCLRWTCWIVKPVNGSGRLGKASLCGSRVVSPDSPLAVVKEPRASVMWSTGPGKQKEKIMRSNLNRRSTSSSTSSELKTKRVRMCVKRPGHKPDLPFISLTWFSFFCFLLDLAGVTLATIVNLKVKERKRDAKVRCQCRTMFFHKARTGGGSGGCRRIRRRPRP